MTGIPPDYSCDLLFGIISGRLFNVLKCLQVKSIVEIPRLDEDSLLHLPGIGTGTVDEYRRLKHTIIYEPESILTEMQQSIYDFHFPSVDKKYCLIPILLFKDDIPTFISDLFLSNGFYTIGDLINFDITVVRRQKGIGKFKLRALLDSFRLLSTPEILQSKLHQYQSTLIDPVNGFKIIPQQFSPDLDRNFEELLTLLLEGYHDSIYKEVFIRRYGWNGSAHYTLEDIGIEFGLTRERIRQIQQKLLSDFTGLFSSGTKRLELIANSKAVVIYNNWSNLFSENSTHCFIYKNESFPPEWPANGALQEFILDSFSWSICVYENVQIYFDTQHFTPAIFEDLISFIKEMTAANSSYIAESELLISCEMHNSSFPQSENFLKILFHELNFIEYNSADQSMLRIASRYVSSYSDMAFRILQHAGTPIHLSEIWKQANSEFAKYNREPIPSPRLISSQLSRNPRFKCIGKSGKWTLSNWNVETRTIPALIEICLEEKKQPMPVSEIAVFVTKLRPDAAASSIAAFIGLQPEKFAMRKDGLVSLTKWASEAERMPIKRKRTAYETYRILYSIFESHSFNPIDFSNLSKEIMKSELAWCNRSIRQRLASLPYLTIAGTSSQARSYTLNKDFDPDLLFTQMEKIRARMLSLLSQGPLPLAVIRSELHRKEIADFSTIYAVVSNNSDIFEKYGRDGGTWVKLKK